MLLQWLRVFHLQYLLLLVKGDLVCDGGGDRSCGWYCGLSLNGAGHCKESLNIQYPHTQDTLTQDTHTPSFDCVCDPEKAPSVTPEYFSLEVPQPEAENGSVAAGSLPHFIQQVVFLPLVRSYFFRSREDLLDPASYGLERATNFYINTKDGLLGAWYLWPEGGAKKPQGLRSKDTLIVYLHGNSMDRGFSHRVSLYHMLTRQGYHVLTIDYRAYGDSSTVYLSESTVLEDGLAVLDWVQDILDTSTPQVLLWGHSLGTAIATRCLVMSNSSIVNGLVLESPFNTMEDEVNHFKMARWTAWVSGIDIQEELARAGVEFRTEDWLHQVSVPVLVLHSDDDPVVPAMLGQRLVDRTREQGKLDIQLVRFGEGNRLRHRYIYRAPGVEHYIQSFLDRARTGQQQRTNVGTNIDLGS